MTTAVYRGVAYNVEEHKLNTLSIIKKQLEKVERQRQAQLAQIKVK